MAQKKIATKQNKILNGYYYLIVWCYIYPCSWLYWSTFDLIYYVTEMLDEDNLNYTFL